ncbi:hypothetical protein HY621_04150 [Candidatus Uhrbacteria bacterium]|nr:hypothetical protein [Candidatus Uhrbacteria bacterium]
MKENQSLEHEKRVHMVYGVMFSIIAVAALVVMVKSYLDANNTVTQTSSIGNATPTLNAYVQTTSAGGAAEDNAAYTGQSATVTLTENTTTDIYIHGAASDTNGCSDITAANATWSIKIYRSNQGAACTADSNDCYSSDETGLSTNNCSGTDNDLDYEFAFTTANSLGLQYYADPTDAGSANAATDWTAQVTVNDGDASQSATDTFEMATTRALSASGQSISYGSVSLGALSSETSITITNTGNASIDVQASATDMSCANSTSIDLDTVDAVGMKTTSLSGESVLTNYTKMRNTANTMDMSIAQRTGAASTGTLYFRFLAPSTGVSGSCNSTVTLTSTAG